MPLSDFGQMVCTLVNLLPKGMIDSMTRHEAREIAFVLLFEKTFTGDTIEDILKNAGEARDVVTDEFAISLAEGTEKNTEAIDEKIYAHSLKCNN